MKRIFHWYIFITLLLVSSNSFSQSTFRKIFNSPYSDAGYSGTETFDGGFVLAGFIGPNSSGLSGISLIKTNSYGDTLWTNCISPLHICTSIIQSNDSGFVLCGTSFNFIPYGDLAVTKTDKFGNVVWTVYIDDTLHYPNSGNVVIALADGNYIACGSISNNGLMTSLVTKISSGGNVIWQKSYDAFSIANSIVELADSSLVFTGSDLFITKIDKDGNLIWTKNFERGGIEVAQSIIRSSDGGLIIGGSTDDIFTGFFEGLIIKTDSGGNILWSNTFSHPGNIEIYSLAQTTDSGIVFTGNFNQSINSPMIYIVKTNQNGSVEWSKSYNIPSGYSTGYSILESLDGGFVVTGSVNQINSFDSKIYFIKTDSLGNTGCTDSTINIAAIPTGFIVNSVINNIDSVFVSSNPILTNFSGIFSSEPCLPLNSELIESVIFSINPNPNAGNMKIIFPNVLISGELTVKTIMGTEIFNHRINNQSEVNLKLTNVANGLYLVTLIHGDYFYTKKVLIQTN